MCRETEGLAEQRQLAERAALAKFREAAREASSLLIGSERARRSGARWQLLLGGSCLLFDGPELLISWHRRPSIPELCAVVSQACQGAEHRLPCPLQQSGSGGAGPGAGARLAGRVARPFRRRGPLGRCSLVRFAPCPFSGRPFKSRASRGDFPGLALHVMAGARQRAWRSLLGLKNVSV